MNWVVRVAPLRSLPAARSEFDYFWPTEQKPEVGTLVFVPFLNRDIAAIITTVLSESPFARRTISQQNTQPLLSAFDIEFLQEMAALLAAPLGRLLQFMLPKISKTTRLAARLPTQKPLLKNNQMRYAWFNSPASREAAFEKIVHGLGKKNNLIIVSPQALRAQEIFSTLPGSFNKFIISGEKMAARRQAMAAWASSEAGVIIIGTHLPLWLPYRPNTTILIDDPTNPFHEQWDGVKYNNNLIARQRSKIFGDSLILLAHSPTTADLNQVQSLPTLAHWPQLIDIARRDPASKHIIPENCTSLIPIAQHTLILLPHLAVSRYQICADCQSLFSETEKLLACNKCHGTNLFDIGMSAAKIETELSKIIEAKNIPVVRFSVEAKSSLTLGMEKIIVIATSASSYLLPLDKFDLIIDLSIDFELLHPEFDSEELLWKKLRSLASKLPSDWRGAWFALTRHPHLNAFGVKDQAGFKYWWQKEAPLRLRFGQAPFSPRSPKS